MKAAIVTAVHDQPGIHFRGLQREVGCSTNTLNYHLRRLGAVEEEHLRGYRRLYPRDIPSNLRDPLAALNHGTRGPVLYTITEQPGITAGAIAEQVDRSPSTVSGHLKVLDGADLIRVEREGRRKEHYAVERTHVVIGRYAERLLDEAADRFIDMWG